MRVFKFIIILTVITLELMLPGLAYAQTGDPAQTPEEDATQTGDSHYFNQGIYYYDPADTSSCFGSGSSSLPEAVPQEYRGIFSEAAAEYDTDVNLLAVIFWKENGGRFPSPQPATWPTSRAGASGPFQFMPKTWAAYGTDGNNDGSIDIQDLTDSAHSSARYLSYLGGKNGTPLGDVSDPYKKGTLVNVMAKYNFGEGNIGKKKSLPAETRNYIENGSTFYLQLSQGTAVGVSVSSGCGGIGVSSDGFVFPLKTTKAVLKRGTDGAVWNMINGDCRKTNYGCHGRWEGGHYYAADIHASTGTVVVASRDGVVVDAGINGDGAFAVTIKGNDGLYYYYTHMGGSNKPVSDGDAVKAGAIMGQVGSRSDTGNGSAAHVHFDISSKEAGSRSRDCSLSKCPDMKFLIDPYEVLVESYKNLPEN